MRKNCFPLLSLALLILLLFPLSAFAYSLDGTSLTVTYTEPSYGDPDIIQPVTVGGGPEIFSADGSDIGDIIMLDGEYIDVGGTNITLSLFGGGDPFPGDSNYQNTGLGDDAAYVFSLFDFGVPGAITAVGVTLTNIIGFNLGTELLFTDDSISVLIGTLGILDQSGVADLGLISLDITFTESTQPPAIPEPSTLLLFGVGLGALVLTRRRR